MHNVWNFYIKIYVLFIYTSYKLCTILPVGCLNLCNISESTWRFMILKFYIQFGVLHQCVRYYLQVFNTMIISYFERLIILVLSSIACQLNNNWGNTRRTMEPLNIIPFIDL